MGLDSFAPRGQNILYGECDTHTILVLVDKTVEHLALRIVHRSGNMIRSIVGKICADSGICFENGMSWNAARNGTDGQAGGTEPVSVVVN